MKAKPLPIARRATWPSLCGAFWPHAACCASIIAATLLVFGRSVGFGYVQFDDVDYVVYTAPVREGLTLKGLLWAFTTFHCSNWHPLTWLSLMLDVSLFGDAAGPKHAVNLLLHACNSMLVYALAYRIIGQSAHLQALLAGLLFAVHPLHVESVAWVAERKDLLCAVFYISALHLHLDFVARLSVRRYLALQAACVLALLAKPMAVTLPVALLILDYWPLRRLDPGAGNREQFLRMWSLLLEKAPLVLMCGGVCVLTIMAQQDAMATTQSVPFTMRLQNTVLSYATYLRQMILPTGLAPLYPIRPIDTFHQLLPAFCALSGILGAAVWLRRAAPWWLAASGWFFLTLIPVIGLVQVGFQAHADRYMYIPSIGFLLAASVALAGMRGPWRLRAHVGAMLFLVFNAGLAWVQVGYWANNYMFYSRILDITPDSWEAHVGLTTFHLGVGDVATAETHAQAALAINSNSEFVQSSLGNLLFAKHDYEGAERSFRAAIAAKPGWALPMVNLGATLEKLGRAAESMDWYCIALAFEPEMYGLSDRIERLHTQLGKPCAGVLVLDPAV